MPDDQKGTQVIALGNCDFHADTNDKGQFIGRCKQFQELRTRPYKSRLDAIDAIVTLVSDKIRNLDGVTEIKRRSH